jgi:hypothetical protein
MFAWYWRWVKQPGGGFVYQLCNVLHYRLLSRSLTASIQKNHITPVTLREKDGMAYKCEWCRYPTTFKTGVLTHVDDIYDDNKGMYAAFCSVVCREKHYRWCKELVPGFSHRYRYPGYHPDVVYITFRGIYALGQGNTLHNTWRIQTVLVQEGNRSGMILIPCNCIGFGESVLLDGKSCIPSAFLSLKKLRRLFPVPAH